MSARQSAEDDVAAGSRSECANCGDVVVYASPDGWVHTVGGADPVACDWVPVAEPGPHVTPPAESGGAS